MYRRLLTSPHVPRLVGSAIVGRIPEAMAAIALVLFIHDATGSFGVTGAATGALAVAGGVASPVKGRLTDRQGQTVMLLASSALFSASFLCLALFARSMPDAAIVGVAGLAGAGRSPLAACMRTLWPRLAPPGEAESAYSFEATAQEVIWVVGPLLVGAAAALGGPSAPMYIAALLSPIGTLGFATAEPSRAWRGADTTRGFAGPLRERGVRAVVAVMLLAQVGLGIVLVTVPAFTTRAGSGAVAGVVVAVWSLASMAGGFVYGSRRWRGPTWRRYVALIALLALSFAPLAAAGTVAELGALLALSGLALAPWLAASDTLTQALAPPEMTTEAFTWIISGAACGQALGAELAGVLIDGSGTGAAFLVAFAAAALAAGAALLMRRALVVHA
jgi:MFS family permease